MPYADTDFFFGRQVVRLIVDFKSNPALVRREYQSVCRLDAELRFLGMRLVDRKKIGPESGFHLFYTRGNVLVRIKTRGSGGKYRGGVPHLTVSLLSGQRTKAGELSLKKGAEEGLFHVGGGLVNKKAEPSSGLYLENKNPRGKVNAEGWSDNTHFDFPDMDANDEGVENLPVDRPRSPWN